MLTKTLKEKNEQLKMDISFRNFIPQKIDKVVKERGFFLYKWLNFEELKKAIEVFHLNIYNKASIVFTSLLVGYFVLLFSGVPELSEIIVPIFFITLFGIVATTIYNSIKMFITLIKNYQVIITDKSIGINGEILPYKDLEKVKDDIKEISETFNEELFFKSKSDNIIEAYRKKFNKKYKNSFKLRKFKFSKFNFFLFIFFTWPVYMFVFLFYMLYKLPEIMMNIMIRITYYFTWSFIKAYLFILNLVTKRTLRLIGNKIETINHLFQGIEKNSDKIEKNTAELNKYLQQVISKNWGTPTYKKINRLFDELSEITNESINDSIELKKALQNYKHSEMFNLKLYNSWIKKKIIEPIAGIDKILKSEISNIEKEMANIDKQLLKTKESSLEAPLILSQKRLIMKKEQIVKNSEMIGKYLGKLR